VCTLEGVEEGSDLYRIADRIFQNREKRDMFVVMEKPHLQLMFLKDEAELLGGRHFSI
jgi:transcriptional regulator